MYHVLYYDDTQLIHVSMMELPPPPPPPPHQPVTPFPPSLSLSLSLSLSRLTFSLFLSQDHTQSASTALQATESLTCLPLLAFSHSAVLLYSLLFSIHPYIYHFCGSTKGRGSHHFIFFYHH
ncbi:hypothetical protein PanWU01x14_063750, partial [Parasponia andersonii]